ncbi:MAG: hypothetical protein ACTSPN_14485 [Promethearchaeota archaeon]
MEYRTENLSYSRDVRDMYDRFMVFELLDTGERQRLNITEDEFRKSKGAGILHPKQVAIIVKEDYRRIFIWKGTEPHVRKKFIASRVAQELQTELVQIGHLHRCKVVTVEQGDETKEFLRVFGFDLEELANISGFTGEVITNVPKITKQPPTTSPISKAKMQSPKKSLPQDKVPRAIQKDTESAKDKLDDILNIELPKNYKRKNILTGNNILYGLITKKVEIFGQHIEETAWEPVKNLPNGVFELDGHKLRIHYNEGHGIEAIEILEPIVEMVKEKQKVKTITMEDGEIDYNKWTVKELKVYCAKKNIKVPSSYRKAQIIQLVKDHSV